MLKQLLFTSITFGCLSLSAATIAIMPVSQTIMVGGAATVDIEVGGLSASQAIGAFDLTVLNDATIVSATNVTFLGALGTPSDQLTSPVLNSGSTNAAETSFESTSTLLSLQTANPFSIFQITYKGLAAGTSTLTFLTAPEIVADGSGTILPMTFAGTASITVQGGMPGVPEPATMGMVSACLLGFAALRFKLAKKQ